MSQVWISSHGHFMMGRLSVPPKPSEVGVLLVPGFLEPSSDLYYFNQAFLEELRQNNILGLAIDCLGHGDSFLYAEDLTLNLMTQSINDSIAFLINQGIKKIGLVGRGLAANLMNKIVVCQDNIAAIFALNPLILNEEHLIKLQKYSDSVDSMITLSKSVLIDLQEVLYMAGVDMSNIEEERVNRQFFSDLVNHRLLFVPDCWKEKCTVIITGDIMRFYNKDMEKYKYDIIFSNYNDRLRIISGIIHDICKK